jgi:hypothetical protein
VRQTRCGAGREEGRKEGILIGRKGSRRERCERGEGGEEGSYSDQQLVLAERHFYTKMLFKHTIEINNHNASITFRLQGIVIYMLAILYNLSVSNLDNIWCCSSLANLRKMSVNGLLFTLKTTLSTSK